MPYQPSRHGPLLEDGYLRAQQRPHPPTLALAGDVRRCPDTEPVHGASTPHQLRHASDLPSRYTSTAHPAGCLLLSTDVWRRHGGLSARTGWVRLITVRPLTGSSTRPGRREVAETYATTSHVSLRARLRSPSGSRQRVRTHDRAGPFRRTTHAAQGGDSAVLHVRYGPAIHS